MNHNFIRRPRVVLADDHSLIVAGLRCLLEPACEVVDQVADGRALVDAALKLEPDLIVLDVVMPLLNGIEAARRVHPALPHTKLLFISMHTNPLYLRETLSAGGSGYVLKSSANEELVSAVHQVLMGKVYIAKEFGNDIVENLQTSTGRKSRTNLKLTDRQREVLQLIAEGRSNKEVATILDISVKTAEFHRAQIMKRLGIRTTAELTRFAIETGLVGDMRGVA